MRRIVLGLAGVACLAAVGSVAARAPMPAGDQAKSAEVWVKAGITIDPEGRVTALHWEGKPKPALQAVQAAVEPRIKALEFEPGRVNGVPAETGTTLSLRLVVVERADNGWDIRIADASTGAAALEMVPPSYPLSRLRSGDEAEVVSEIEIGADGSVSLLDADYRGTSKKDSSRKEFLDAPTAAIKGWTYRVERVGGHPVATRMSVPIRFCVVPSKRPWCDGSEGQTRSANGRQAPADEAIALESVTRLKTDLSTTDI